jgi:hypothetical protein
MATTTPNFGWPVPTSTDLVKDGATAIESLGDSIDASLLDLKGGTSGQVLSKNSNTDMDFTWVTSDDANAIQNAIVDAKGDLITATAADTPSRLAVGTNGQILQADSTAATGLKWATPAASTSGLTFITGTTFSAVSSVSLPTATFSATYLNYRVIFVTDSASATGAAITLRLRISGADNSTANHYGAFSGASAGGVAQIIAANGLTSFPLGTTDSAGTNGSLYTLDIINPYASIRTNINGGASLFNPNGTNAGGSMGFFFNGTTSFDAFSVIVASGTITGHYKIYGYANS